MKEKLLSLKNKPVVLLAVAAVLLLLSTVGATQAAITSYSENYETTIKAPTLNASLMEKQDGEFLEIGATGNSVLLSKMLEQSEGKLILGKTYTEELKVRNTGTTDAYVRVVITKNWSDAAGNIDRKLSPENIEILLAETGNWVKDDSASTDERTVLYYKNILPVYDGTNADKSDTSIFMETVKVRSGFDLIVEDKNEDNNDKIITYSYPYDGYKMNVTVEVDAVQTYDAVEAIKSAWGVNVEASETDGSLTFKF